MGNKLFMRACCGFVHVCFTRTCLFVSVGAWADHNKIGVYDDDDDDKLSGNLYNGLILLLLVRVCVCVRDVIFTGRRQVFILVQSHGGKMQSI